MTEEQKKALEALRDTMTHAEYIYTWSMVAQGKMTLTIDGGYVILTKERHDA